MKKTWIPSSLDPSLSKYMALLASIEQGVAEGTLRPGDKLPSNREISEFFGVTVATVSRAMGEAARRGLVEGRVGSGTFIRETRTAANATDTIDLSLNTLPAAVVADVLQGAMGKLAPDALHDSLFSYHSYLPSAAHRQVAAGWIGAAGQWPDPDSLLCTTGVHQGLLASFRALLKPGDRAVCEALTYTGIKRIAEYSNVQLIGARCDEDGVVPEAVEEALERSGARVVILTPTMHNPTTATLSLERRLALAAILRKHDAMLIEDGVNVPLANDGLPLLATLVPERTFYLTGFSKCVASGFRLGYAVVPPAYVGPFHEALVSTQWIGPGFYLALAESMLTDGSAQRCIERHRNEARERLARIRPALPGMREPNTAGYHVWVPAASGMLVDDFCTQALQAGVRLSPGSHFAIAGSSAPAGYRVSIGTVASGAELGAAAARLASVTGELPRAIGTLI